MFLINFPKFPKLTLTYFILGCLISIRLKIQFQTVWEDMLWGCYLWYLELLRCFMRGGNENCYFNCHSPAFWNLRNNSGIIISLLVFLHILCKHSHIIQHIIIVVFFSRGVLKFINWNAPCVKFWRIVRWVFGSCVHVLVCACMCVCVSIILTYLTIVWKVKVTDGRLIWNIVRSSQCSKGT